MAKNKILVLSGEDVCNCLSMADAITAMREAFVQISGKQARVPLRVSIDIPESEGNSLFMPVYLPSKKLIGVKIVTLFRYNYKNRLPLIHAQMMVFDGSNGVPLALMDGENLTALRTGAASGVATDLMAAHDARVATIFGAGVQGETQLEAVCHVRDIAKAFVVDNDEDKSRAFSLKLRQILDIPVIHETPGNALPQSDIICTATSSPTPVFEDNLLKPGAHINAIGSYKPSKTEIPAKTVQRAALVVDSRKACLEEAGEIVQQLRKGLIDKDHIVAELGELISGKKKYHRTADSISLFKSVGNAVQDLEAASRILEVAREKNIGEYVMV